MIAMSLANRGIKMIARSLRNTLMLVGDKVIKTIEGPYKAVVIQPRCCLKKPYSAGQKQKKNLGFSNLAKA